MNQGEKASIKSLLALIYDVQQLRIQAGNRLVRTYKTTLGVSHGRREDAEDANVQEVLNELRAENPRLADTVVKKIYAASDENSGARAMFGLAKIYQTLRNLETEHTAHIEKLLREHPIYPWLETVRGAGPLMAGVLIAAIDISKAPYASSLWKLSGYDVATDGHGRSRRAEHLAPRKFADTDGNETEASVLTYNPWLKTKLRVLATLFMRLKNPVYEPLYRGYRHRIDTAPEHKDKTPGHRHAMALRYIVKRFLTDLYREWRIIEGLPVQPEYHEKYHGHTHGMARAV